MILFRCASAALSQVVSSMCVVYMGCTNVESDVADVVRSIKKNPPVFWVEFASSILVSFRFMLVE